MTNSLSLNTGDVPPPAPYGAVPSERQWQWHRLEQYAFIHFTINTFTDREWGYGDEEPRLFHPTAFDADQIVETLAHGGMKAVILTCKHHDGFCLWPTRTTEHNITRTEWRQGKGDVVKAISDACQRQGLPFGVYLSPWDRNSPHYGKPEYVALYREQLRELLTEYGPIFEVWFDGANGGDGYYGGARETRTIDRQTYYGWPETWEAVRRLQPQAVLFSDVGPDLRWVGNEAGFAPETSWATYTPVARDGGIAAPGLIREELSGTGHRNGAYWLPAECDVSIRPGWFWHAHENEKVKTPDELLALYFRSVGHGGSFLLNAPPDRRGLLHEADVASLREFGKRLHALFQTNLAANARFSASNTRGDSPQFVPDNLRNPDRERYWATDDDVTTPELIVDFGKEVEFRIVRLREYIPLGQRIEGVALDAWQEGDWREFASATSIGACRLIRLPEAVTTQKVRLRITQSPCCIAFSELAFFAE